MEDVTLPNRKESNAHILPNSPSSLIDNFNSEPVLILESPEGKIENPWMLESQKSIHETDRILSKPAEDGSVTAELTSGNSPRGLTPGLTTNRDSDEHEDDSELDSAADASVFSSLTESSLPTNVFEVASIALVRFLATDDTLRDLCVAAASTGRFSAEIFQREYLLLLRRYGFDLRSEAQNQVQEQAARFVRKRACDAARAIRRHFFETSETLLHELLRYPEREAVVVEDYLSGIDEEYCVSEDSASEVEFSEALPEHLDSIKEFLLESEAIKRLRHDLGVFLTPGQDDDAEAKGIESEKIVLATNAASDIEPAQSDENVREERLQSGLMYLKRTRSFPIHFLRFGFWLALFWRVYIFCITYMLSLVSQANWERYARDQSSHKLIYLYDVRGEARESYVRLDTGSDLNVISAKKVSELGREAQVDKSNHGLLMRSVDGHTYQPRCSLELRWSLRKNTRIHKERFFVVDDCPEELLFSDPYIQRLGIIRNTWEAAANLNVFDKKYVETDADKEFKKLQRDAKAALEAKKRLAALQKQVSVSPIASTPPPVGTSSSASNSSSAP